MTTKKTNEMDNSLRIIQTQIADGFHFQIIHCWRNDQTLSFILEGWRKMKNITINRINQFDCLKYTTEGMELEIDITDIPGPFDEMREADLIFAFIGEQIFGIPGYSDGPSIHLTTTTDDGQTSEGFISDDRMDDCLRKLYTLRRLREMTLKQAQIILLKACIDTALKHETNSKAQHSIMEEIGYIGDFTITNTPDIMIHIDTLHESIPQEPIDEAIRLLEAIDNNG